MVDTPQTHSLSTLSDNLAEFFEQLEASHQVITLTVDGHPEFVIQEASAYQRLLDLAALGSAEEGIRQGLADLAAGRTRPASEVFDELRAKYGIPR